MTDEDLYTLCIYMEARGEPYEGKVAVARVLANRMALKFFSDGTVSGTVLHYDQFSWAYFDMVNGAYARVCSTRAGATLRAEELLPIAKAGAMWDDCQRAITDGKVGSSYAWGPEGQKLDDEPRAVMYVNLSVARPTWATPPKKVATIFHHTFFRS